MSKNISEQLIVYLVMDFLNEANVEHIQNLTPYCCKTYDECKHQVQQTQNNHR